VIEAARAIAARRRLELEVEPIVEDVPVACDVRVIAAAESAAPALSMEPREVRRVRPFEGAERRHLHVLRKAGATPPGLPRRAGMARKRPFRGG